MNTNHGIQITGGTVTAGAMTAGHGATATNTAPAAEPVSLEDLRLELRALVELLRAQPDVPADQVTVAELAEREAARPKPDKGSLLNYLQVLASGAGSVAAVGTAVTALQSAVTALLSRSRSRRGPGRPGSRQDPGLFVPIPQEGVRGGPARTVRRVRCRGDDVDGVLHQLRSRPLLVVPARPRP